MSTDPDSRILRRLLKSRNTEDPLHPVIDEYYSVRDEAEERIKYYPINMKERIRPGGRLSPSSIGGCLRQAGFKFTGVKAQRRVDPDSMMVFEQGHWIHHKWQATFRDMELVLGPARFQVLHIEGKVQIPELFIAGNDDAVVKINGVRYVIDFKSINDQGWQWVYGNDGPKAEHVSQLTTYMKGRRIKRGIIMYENKNDQRLLMYVITLDDSVWHEVQEWCEDVIRFLQTEGLPPMHPECNNGNYLWGKCPYAYLCYGDKTDRELTKLMYKKWKGIDYAWRRGLRELAKWEQQTRADRRGSETTRRRVRHRRRAVR